jgi:hypothetical protein
MDQVNLPEGCEHLYGALFSIPFSMIRTPDPEDETEEFVFSNPRLLVESGQADLIDKSQSSELRESIKKNTLLCPLVCRWVDEGDSVYPQLVGGDRRYRAISYLINKKEMVADPKSLKLNAEGQWEYSQSPADQVYKTVACQVFSVNNDLDALALSWAENKSRINLTDGNEVAEVHRLRSFGASDERILEILQHNEKWLAETDNLIENLDDATFDDLCEGRVDRGAAIELMSIEDAAVRNQRRLEAVEFAQESWRKKMNRIQKQVESVLEEKEVAEGAVADANWQKDDEFLEEAQTNLAELEKKATRIVKERDETKPVVTSKEVKKAKAAAVEEEEDGERSSGAIRTLSAKKISSGLEQIEALIANEGRCPKDTFSADLEALELVRRIIAYNILENDPDFVDTIRTHALEE